ncbi:serine hydrolase [Xanthomonadaceae bacterium JHOS43]|nr:serine hydrolase [Xanthomonadaceae bacterium JHOS43]
MALVTGLVAAWALGSPQSSIAAAAVASTAPSATRAAPAPARLTEREQKALAERTERLAERILRDAKGSGMAIAIVQDDTVLLERGFGVTDTRTSEKVTADTVFRIASLSKAFAGTLAAMLVREGAMRYDSRIIDYLPEFKLRNLQAAQTLTVQDILSHRVGLPYNTFDRLLEQDEPYPLLVARLGEIDPVCDGSECYGYQNIAFSLIGDMVFATTGNFYSQQVEKRIFHPLGMFTATFGRDGLEESASWARPHIRQSGRWTPVRPKETYYRIPPAAGVNASIRDLSLWMRAHLGHAPEVLGPDLLDEVHAAQARTPGELGSSPWRRERLRDAHYALGWRVYDYSGHTLIYHAGAVQGYRAMLGLLPDHGFGMVVVWNSESSAPSGLLATTLDQVLKLPARDWLQLDRPVRRGQLR